MDPAVNKKVTKYMCRPLNDRNYSNLIVNVYSVKKYSSTNIWR